MESVNHKRAAIRKKACADENRVNNDNSKEDDLGTGEIIGNDGINGEEVNNMLGKENSGVFGNEDSGDVNSHETCTEYTISNNVVNIDKIHEDGSDGSHDENNKNKEKRIMFRLLGNRMLIWLITAM
ncbi:hypothetical protein Tco_1193107 [Tanacetum coccineum]